MTPPIQYLIVTTNNLFVWAWLIIIILQATPAGSYRFYISTSIETIIHFSASFIGFWDTNGQSYWLLILSDIFVWFPKSKPQMTVLDKGCLNQ